jgi:SNF2 family DNA or RNA helicase
MSTEAGGAGLNLQMTDILINFELLWNPAKKNQRIGRIDRLGQRLFAGVCKRPTCFPT